MKYIVHKRFKQKAICGDVNLAATTECEEVNGMIYHDHKRLCVVTSDNAHLFFARNDDGNGIERGALTRSIVNTLSKQDSNYQARWDKVWSDETCRAYKRHEHADHWIWNHAFYNADIATLKYIADLVGARR